eukprot:CAMPEP_0181321354 /NCGR_PEP_ID=MMETSP1101-20121128/18635_1 /TAXON_ID=46948 /ORGANISM="Rhodomonas abbreviata, Strain Caron Lab Isolate" /LENGTH=136 /DNA_ID=CAMNT_0023429165 /DNA_START=331 /DNA_END=741 /DNA_ORIENTATION=-
MIGEQSPSSKEDGPNVLSSIGNSFKGIFQWPGAFLDASGSEASAGGHSGTVQGPPPPPPSLLKGAPLCRNNSLKVLQEAQVVEETSAGSQSGPLPPPPFPPPPPPPPPIPAEVLRRADQDARLRRALRKGCTCFAF